MLKRGHNNVFFFDDWSIDYSRGVVASRGIGLRSRKLSVNYPHVNRALQKMAKENDYIEYVSPEGLTDKGDRLHFNSASLREFGVRYFDRFKEVNKVIQRDENFVTVDYYSEIERL